ncbi:GNAT family N-acetyltransferase [Sediminitomix flava]|uniref:Acetyltransferase (GNAT) family protein n=1 Tax=Sediminitomix flava TaxID=379075 RepID=A0A315ZBP6_SEDFL|nr:GNAT family N-acetyltransferase [Sediminitomix flava]PWJ42208.1 acetyltransferase (GNAT) family protein [Sediminitomix flava]
MIIKEIKHGSEDYKRTVELRDAVLRKPLNLEFSAEELDNEFDSFHLAALNDHDEVVGCLVLQPLENQQIKMRQVAIREDFQGKGLGKVLVNFSEVFSYEQDFNEMIVHSRDVAMGFYEKLGYTKVGEPFEEVGIKHFRLEKKL